MVVAYKEMQGRGGHHVIPSKGSGPSAGETKALPKVWINAVP